MAVKAIKEYVGEVADNVEKFHGNQLLYVGWDDHLMFCAPFCFMLPPQTRFSDLLEKVLPPAFGAHPDFAKIDWSKVEWLKSGQPVSIDYSKTLAELGLEHKDALRLKTPGLNGLYGASF